MKEGRLFRLSFSRAVCEHAAAVAGGGYDLQRFRIHKGKELGPHDSSATGLYAIVSRKRDYVLRISLNRETALMLCDFKFRYLQEVRLSPCS